MEWQIQDMEEGYVIYTLCITRKRASTIVSKNSSHVLSVLRLPIKNETKTQAANDLYPRDLKKYLVASYSPEVADVR